MSIRYASGRSDRVRFTALSVADPRAPLQASSSPESARYESGSLV